MDRREQVAWIAWLELLALAAWGWSGRELERVIGVPHSTWGGWRKGERAADPRRVRAWVWKFARAALSGWPSGGLDGIRPPRRGAEAERFCESAGVSGTDLLGFVFGQHGVSKDVNGWPPFGPREEIDWVPIADRMLDTLGRSPEDQEPAAAGAIRRIMAMECADDLDRMELLERRAATEAGEHATAEADAEAEAAADAVRAAAATSGKGGPRRFYIRASCKVCGYQIRGTARHLSRGVPRCPVLGCVSRVLVPDVPQQMLIAPVDTQKAPPDPAGPDDDDIPF